MTAREHGTPQASRLSSSAASYPGARQFLLLALQVEDGIPEGHVGKGVLSLSYFSIFSGGHFGSSVSFGLGPGKDTASFCPSLTAPVLLPFYSIILNSV